MYVITIDGTDSSAHTKYSDALVQKNRFESSGHTNVLIIEKDTFEPPQD